MKKYRIAPEVKEQVINRIKNEDVSVAEAVRDAGVSDASVYTWLRKIERKSILPLKDARQRLVT